MGKSTEAISTTSKCFVVVTTLIVVFFLGFMSALAIVNTLIYSDATAPPTVRDTPVVITYNA